MFVRYKISEMLTNTWGLEDTGQGKDQGLNVKGQENEITLY